MRREHVGLLLPETASFFVGPVACALTCVSGLKPKLEDLFDND
jgi:hypothetical protein